MSTTAFYQYGALGNPAGGGTFSEHTGAFAAGWAIADRWAAFAELSAIVVPAQKTESRFTIIGTTFAVEPWLVLDVGATVGLSSDAPDLQLFLGCTYNLGRPFATRR